MPGDPRAAEPGLPPGRHHPPLPGRRADPPLHGHEHVRRVHGDAGDRAGQGLARGPARPGLPVRLRPLDRARRGDQHREGAGRARRASCSAPGWSASAPSPAAGCQGAERIIMRRHVRAAPRARPRARGPPIRGSGGPDTVARVLEETGGFGADYTFEATGLGRGDAPGGRGRPHGLGALHRRRRRRQGRDARHRPALPDHRPARVRLVVRRRQGPRRGAGSSSSATSTARSTSTRSSRTASRSTRSTAASS